MTYTLSIRSRLRNPLDFIPRFLAMAEFEQAHSAHMANENVHFMVVFDKSEQI